LCRDRLRCVARHQHLQRIRLQLAAAGHGFGDTPVEYAFRVFCDNQYFAHDTNPFSFSFSISSLTLPTFTPPARGGGATVVTVFSPSTGVTSSVFSSRV